MGFNSGFKGLNTQGSAKVETKNLSIVPVVSHNVVLLPP